jgi:hypothetical protein
MGENMVDNTKEDVLRETLADMSYEERVEHHLGGIREFSLPTHDQNWILFPCSGGLSNLIIPLLMLRTDSKNATKELVLPSREKVFIEESNTELEHINISSGQVWKNALEVLMGKNLKTRVSPVSYSETSQLEERLQKQTDRLHPEETTLIFLPRYEFMGLLEYFDKEILQEQLHNILGMEIGESNNKLRKLLSKEAKMNLKTDMLSLPEIYKEISESRSNFETSFCRGQEQEILKDLIKIKEIYEGIVSKNIGEVDPKALAKKSSLLASNIVGAREFGRILKNINYKGKIISLTNPLESVTSVLCASSGLPPERVLGFRHNDLERVLSFYREARTPMDQYEGYGLHQRIWDFSEDELPYHIDCPATRVEISRYVRALSSSMKSTLDTSIYLVLLLENMVRIKEGKGGFAWHHTTEEGEGIYLSGIAQLNKEQVFPDFSRVDSRIKNIVDTLKEKGAVNVVRGIKCEMELFDEFYKKNILSKKEESLSLDDIQLRENEVNEATKENKNNQFYVVGFDNSMNAYLFNDQGKAIESKNVGTTREIHSIGDRIFTIGSEAASKKGGAKEYALHVLNTSKSSITEERSIKITNLPTKQKADIERAFRVILPHQEKIYHSLGEDAFESEDYTKHLKMEGNNPVMLENDPKHIYFISGDRYLARARIDSLEEEEVILEEEIDEIKSYKDKIIILTEERAELYDPVKTEKERERLNGVSSLEWVNTDGEQIFNVDNGILYSSRDKPTRLEENNMISYEISDNEVGWINENELIVQKIGTTEIIFKTELNKKLRKGRVLIK